MDKIIAYCGIECTTCPAFIAHQQNNDELRRKTAVEWSKAFGIEVKPESINCTGCLSSSQPQINYCAECKIRLCGSEKQVKNCAHCDEYICDKLEELLKKVPEARKNLEIIKKDL